MSLDFKMIRPEIEKIFDVYRRHKYYTLFKDDINVSITSHIDKIGGGRSNVISDQTANAAIKRADEKSEAEEYVSYIEFAVDQLPDIEKELIQERYMCRDHHYISDYTVYKIKMRISDKTYSTVRERAFENLYTMLVRKNSEKIPN